MRLTFRVTSWVVLASLLLCVALPVHADGQTHVVQAGDTLARIAGKYGVTIQAIQAANNLAGDRIYVGQVLIIPVAAAPALSSAQGIHVVQSGENLFRIGLKYNIPWETIRAANGLAGTQIYVGQRLVIPGGSAQEEAQQSPPASTEAPQQPPPATEQPAQPVAGDTVHIVQAGETLFKIGLKYGVAWTAIAAANGISGSRIYSGQSLTIPLGGAPAEATVSPPPAPAGTGKRFLVDLSEQRLYAYEGDTLVRSTLISSGLPAYPTVTGTYQIYLRYVSAPMTGPGYYLPNVPYVMYFYKGYGLHGTYWHSNFGTPMSHGCVNMPTPEAEWAFYWSDYGTPVTIQY